MDSPPPVEADLAQLTPQQIMEEFITQRVDRWRARQVKVPDEDLAAYIVAMCWDCGSMPRSGPGCLMPHDKGGWVYVPYDESREGLPCDLQRRVEMLDGWFQNSANAHALRQMDKWLEEAVDEFCFWEFLDGGNAARVDFHGKIKMLAKYRLMRTGVDVSPTDPLHPQFRFNITDITEFGNVRMKWHTVNWNCTELEVVRCLEAFSRPGFTEQSVLDSQLKNLETIHHPEDAAQEAQVLAEKLRAQQQEEQKPDSNEPEWLFFLCDATDASKPLEERVWMPLRKRPNDVKLMKRMSREAGKWAVVIRSWHLRHYKLCYQIYKLQLRQLEHCKALEERPATAAAPDGDGNGNGNGYGNAAVGALAEGAQVDADTGKPYFDGG